ncbi:hypothetical protein BKA63DRAFT_597882 [Paraphoma chrysanthemicola]|nr:hypothetical protein BKA63DRAFT_597882 [Paraphoma chrysanthemicola]
MVFPPSCPGVCVEILVDDQPVQEYDDVEKGPARPNTVTKYIEAQSDKEFAVRLKVTDDFLYPASDLEMRTIIDRSIINERMVRARELYLPQGTTVEGRACRVGITTNAEQKFLFNALDVVECEQLRGGKVTKDDLESIGLITVELQFIRNVRLSNGHRTHPINSVSHRGVSEKELKLNFKTHRASLSPCVPKNCDWVKYDRVGREPFVTIYFKYRSLDGLRALEIIPPPIPLEDRPVEELNNAELQEVVNKLKRDLASRAVKLEPNNNSITTPQVIDDDDDDVVLVEQHNRKCRRGQDREVIVID